MKNDTMSLMFALQKANKCGKLTIFRGRPPRAGVN